jgi:hypothetical protein
MRRDLRTLLTALAALTLALPASAGQRFLLAAGAAPTPGVEDLRITNVHACGSAKTNNLRAVMR